MIIQLKKLSFAVVSVGMVGNLYCAEPTVEQSSKKAVILYQLSDLLKENKLAMAPKVLGLAIRTFPKYFKNRAYFDTMKYIFTKWRIHDGIAEGFAQQTNDPIFQQRICEIGARRRIKNDEKPSILHRLTKGGYIIHMASHFGPQGFKHITDKERYPEFWNKIFQYCDFSHPAFIEYNPQTQSVHDVLKMDNPEYYRKWMHDNNIDISEQSVTFVCSNPKYRYAAEQAGLKTVAYLNLL